MDSSPTETLYKHLGNIADLGNICSLKEVSLTKKPLITGKVIQMLPIVKKSKYQVKDSLTIILKEVCSPDKRELLQFKAIFIEDAAQLVGNLDICDGDYIAFCNVKLFPVPSLKRNFQIFSKQIIVGLERSNDIANVFYKRKNMTQWSSFHHINSELLENRIIDFEGVVNEPVSSEPVPSERPDSNSFDQNPIPSTSRNHQVVTSTENDEISPSTSGSSDILLLEHVESIEKANDSRPSEISKPRNVMVNLMKEFKQTTKKNSSDEDICKGRNEKCTDDKYQYLKLAQLKKDCKVNVYGIVRRIVKKLTLLSNNKCHLVINIIDDSGVNDFLVNIFSSSFEAFPNISPNCIIRIHRLQVEEYKDGLTGKVIHGRDVVVFNRENTSITHSIANKFTITDSDVKRVEELKEWALENITNFRPFTSLNSLELKHKKINLLGKVSYVKVYEDRPVMVLRIRDGTKCAVPYERLNLDLDIWAKVITEAKTFHSEGEDIDIVIDEPDGNFKTLKIGDEIELLDVEVITKTRFMKTNAIDYLKFFMKGIWENLKIIPPKERFPVQNTCSNRTDIQSKSSYTLNIVKKRRLFDPDKSIVFENDDLKRNQDKATTTDNLENNYEMDKRKADIDLEKMIKSSRTVNEVENAPTVGQHNVVGSSIPRVENDLVLRDGSKETDGHLLKWPQPISKDPFNIKVNLISTSPAIDEDCDEEEVLSMIKSYCSTCHVFFSYHQAKWVTVESEPAAFCSKCKMLGHYKELNFVLTLKTYLQDERGEVASAVILGDHAENFLGCTVADICSSSEARIKVRDVLNSYFYRTGKENKSLIASIMPIANKDEFKYHVTAFLRLDQINSS